MCGDIDLVVLLRAVLVLAVAILAVRMNGKDSVAPHQWICLLELAFERLGGRIGSRYGVAGALTWWHVASHSVYPLPPRT